MEKVRGKNIVIEVQDECYWLNREDYIKMHEWMKEQEIKLKDSISKVWLTLIKK